MKKKKRYLQTAVFGIPVHCPLVNSVLLFDLERHFPQPPQDVAHRSRLGSAPLRLGRTQVDDAFERLQVGYHQRVDALQVPFGIQIHPVIAVRRRHLAATGRQLIGRFATGDN